MRYPRWRDGLILDANRGAVSPVWEKKIKLKKKKNRPGALVFLRSVNCYAYNDRFHQRFRSGFGLVDNRPKLILPNLSSPSKRFLQKGPKMASQRVAW